MIIDFHTHTFPDKIAEKTISKLAMVSRTLPFSDGSLEGLHCSMQKAGVDYSINLPVMTSVAQVEKVNLSMIRGRDDMFTKGIITFGGMHPDYENYKEQLRILKENGIPGIKIHPAYQNVFLDDLRFLRIIDCASEYGLLITTHAGMDIGLYDKNYASVKAVLNVIEQVHPQGFILAHMGGWIGWEDVKRDLAGAPVYFDTAFSLGRITPNPACHDAPIQSCNMDRKSFVELVRAHGAQKILFASDSPWGGQAEYIDFMKNTSLSDSELQLIFSDNAIRLLRARGIEL